MTIDEYIKGSRVDRDGSWGTAAEVITLAHTSGVNIATQIRSSSMQKHRLELDG